MKKTLLYLDDMAECHEKLKKIVDSLLPGWRLLPAEKPETAERQLREQSIDYLVSDVNLDLKNPKDTAGLDFVSKIKEESYSGKILVVSSEDFNDYCSKIDVPFAFKKEFYLTPDSYIPYVKGSNERSK